MKKQTVRPTHFIMSSSRKSLVYACAWCNESEYIKLKRGQRYTHGICKTHKELMLSQYKT